LKTYEGDVQDLGLDFTVVVEEFGETRIGKFLLNSKTCYKQGNPTPN
jgi:hypothetical protein